MTSRLVRLFLIIITTVLIDIGLAMVFLDSAFRGHMPTIQTTAFLLIFAFPVFVLVALLTQYHRVLIILSLVSTLVISYDLYFYQEKMVMQVNLIPLTIGYGVTIFLLWRLWESKPIQADESLRPRL
jgi:hypothetical protein